jgi:hypothetical protein
MSLKLRGPADGAGGCSPNSWARLLAADVAGADLPGTLPPRALSAVTVNLPLGEAAFARRGGLSPV